MELWEHGLEGEWRVTNRDRWENNLIRNLTAVGVLMGATRYRRGSMKDWTCDFSITNRSVGQEEIKVAIEHFLQGMFSAFNFRFYRRPDGTLYVQFDIERI